MTRVLNVDRLELILSYNLAQLDLLLQHLTRDQNVPGMSIRSYKAEIIVGGIELKVIVTPSGWDNTERIHLRIAGNSITRILISSPKLVPFVGTNTLSIKSESNLCHLMLRLRNPDPEGQIIRLLKESASFVNDCTTISCKED